MVEESGIVQFLKKEHERLSKEMKGISAAFSAFGAAYKGEETTVRRTVSAASKSKMAAAQKARWLKVKSAGEKQAAPGEVSLPNKRMVSAASRKRMAAAQKARWVKVKAATK